MARIDLVLSNERDRALLEEYLARDHDVCVRDQVATDDDRSFDLLILDGPSLERHSEAFAAWKAKAIPAFLPVLLVVSEFGPDDLPDPVWDVVDEVIETPVQRTELSTRANSLLRQREQSLALKRQKEASEERMRSLFETAPDPTVVLTPDGVITDVNQAFGDVFDVESPSVVGERLGSLDLPNASGAERVLLSVSDPESDAETETIHWQRDGDQPVVTEVHVDAISRLSGVTERIGIFRDVSEREKRVQQLRDQNERLEAFASTLTHDLRNPLGIAQGSLEVARETGDEEAFDGVEEGLERMADLIDETLELAREGKFVVDPESVSLSAAAETAWETVETSEASLAFEDTHLLADRSRLTALLQNLFRNAVEHAGSTVSVRVGPLTAAGSSQADAPVSVDGQRETVDGFFVEDDGPGIPLSDAEMAFEAGYTTDEDRGTGMGLRIVNEIVEGHDWTVELARSDAGGARFEFRGVETPE